FSGPEPGVGVYSLSDPERPTLLYRASSLDGSALVSDTALSAPVSLGATRFAVALGGQGHGPALALFSSTSPGVDVMAVAAPTTGTNAASPTSGPGQAAVPVTGAQPPTLPAPVAGAAAPNAGPAPAAPATAAAPAPAPAAPVVAPGGGAPAPRPSVAVAQQT